MLQRQMARRRARAGRRQDYREYAAGAGWKVWVVLPGNPAVRQALRHAALLVPTYKKPDQIAVPDEPLCR